jgi:hypothetical protein
VGFSPCGTLSAHSNPFTPFFRKLFRRAENTAKNQGGL